MIEKQGNYKVIAGIDEAGRGPLAGPVYAAAVILNPQKPINGLTDSKLLSEKAREALFQVIQQDALAWAIARAEVDEIDRINILQATFLAMQRAVSQLSIVPELALVDGNQKPRFICPVQTIVNGDKLEPAISAASILAKVARDREMRCLDEQYPGYGFAKHKGYGTPEHYLALKSKGPSPIHRRTFAPVAALLEEQ